MSKAYSLNVRSRITHLQCHVAEIISVLDEDKPEDFLMMQAIFNHPVKKDETGGNMKGCGINCWKNYAIKEPEFA